eukprot:m.565330 g.565330  ORF g.565330 m.565330 type:complete len:260 (-) comp57823_c0_seq7:68-847(-)
MQFHDLGDFFLEIGETGHAMRHYSRMREYSTTPAHIALMSLKIVKTSAESGNWANILSYATKALTSQAVEKEPMMRTQLQLYLALAHLSLSEYANCAATLLNVTFEASGRCNDIMSQRDIANYASVCVLATAGRATVKHKLLQNPEFKQFLELVPEMREALRAFDACNYNGCLHQLSQLEAEFQLDLHFQSHVAALFKTIRSNAILQYVRPFASVDLAGMASAFGQPIEVWPSPTACASALHFPTFTWPHASSISRLVL